VKKAIMNNNVREELELDKIPNPPLNNIAKANDIIIPAKNKSFIS